MEKENALKILRELHDKALFSERTALETFVPELKESEDEKIRKELITHCRNTRCVTEEGAERIAKWIDWIEKQGEQKDSVVDFKAEDWYVSKVDGKIYNAKFMEKTPTNQARKLEIEKAAMSATGIIEQEEWFIKGAEWSDKNPSYISSEKQGEKKPIIDMITPEESLGIDSETYNKIVNDCIFGENKPKFKIGDWVTNGLCTWRIDSINGEMYYEYGVSQGSYIENIDKEYRLWTIQDAKDGDVLAIDPWSDYPSSFVAIYKKQNGEDFDSYCFVGFDGRFYKGENGHSTEKIHPATKEQRDTLFAKMKESSYKWLEETKELKKIEQKSSAWSEEDERNLNDAILFIETGTYSLDKDNLINWLKSLRPQNTWKPSDEQMVVLELASKYERVFTPKQIDILIGLKEQLKKLKGE